MSFASFEEPFYVDATISIDGIIKEYHFKPFEESDITVGDIISGIQNGSVIKNALGSTMTILSDFRFSTPSAGVAASYQAKFKIENLKVVYFYNREIINRDYNLNSILISWSGKPGEPNTQEYFNNKKVYTYYYTYQNNFASQVRTPDGTVQIAAPILYDTDTNIIYPSTFPQSVNDEYNYLLYFILGGATVSSKTPKYNIIIDKKTDGGTILTDVINAAEGDTVTITAQADPGYELDYINATNPATGALYTLTQVNSYTWTFTMPPNDVTIVGAFKIEIPKYNITIDKKSDGGTILVDVATAVEGDTVTITAQANSGYELDYLNATNPATGALYTLTQVNSYTWTFTMPPNDVTIVGAFKTEIPKYTVNVSSVTGGIATVSTNKPTAGQRVTITFTPAINYSVKTDDVRVQNGLDTLLLTWIDETHASFVTPSPMTTIETITVIPAFYISAPNNFNYLITVESNPNGYAVPSAYAAKRGTLITVKVTPNSGYLSSPNQIYVLNGIDGVEKSWISTDTFTFVMPEANVVIRLAFEPESVEPMEGYIITVGDTDNGYGTAPANAGIGETVTVNLFPAEGYSPDRAHCHAWNGNDPMRLNWTSNNQFTFVTPSPATTIESIFVQVRFVKSDPYAPGGTTEGDEPIGGDGDFDPTSDKVEPSIVPTTSVVNTGLVTLFRPTQAQIAELGNVIWTSALDIWQNVKNTLSNPMDYFIAFNILPCTPAVGTSRTIKLGVFNTDVSMPPVLSQWYEHDCGSVKINKFFGSALDYSPFTKVQLMLPFIGSVQLNTDEIMDRTLSIRYRIDLLSGSCVALILIDGDVYYQFTGECAINIPLTGADWSRVYTAAVGAVGTAIAGAAMVGAADTAAGAAATISSGVAATNATVNAAKTFSEVSQATKGLRGAPAMRQALVNAAEQSAIMAEEAASSIPRISSGIKAAMITRAISNTAGQVMGAKFQVQHSGAISGSVGMLGVRVPYLIIEYPNQSLAENYKHYVGYPSNMYAKLGNLHGYTECEQVIANGIDGTDSEYAELLEALKGGVYL